MNNGHEPATKADLRALEQRMEGKIDALEQRVEGKIDGSEQRVLDRVGEMIRDSETRLLQAFYSYADANNKRVGQLEANDQGVISRLGTLENRILEIEKRLNMPPQ
ncbi:MAG: hypothetical protein LAP38_24520 [Acidobacteriia bacterium]|nr:hypothetical protein [Terriglobia bacterium]